MWVVTFSSGGGEKVFECEASLDSTKVIFSRPIVGRTFHRIGDGSHVTCQELTGPIRAIGSGQQKDV